MSTSQWLIDEGVLAQSDVEALRELFSKRLTQAGEIPDTQNIERAFESFFRDIAIGSISNLEGELIGEFFSEATSAARQMLNDSQEKLGIALKLPSQIDSVGAVAAIAQAIENAEKWNVFDEMVKFAQKDTPLFTHSAKVVGDAMARSDSRSSSYKFGKSLPNIARVALNEGKETLIDEFGDFTGELFASLASDRSEVTKGREVGRKNRPKASTLPRMITELWLPHSIWYRYHREERWQFIETLSKRKVMDEGGALESLGKLDFPETRKRLKRAIKTAGLDG